MAISNRRLSIDDCLLAASCLKRTVVSDELLRLNHFLDLAIIQVSGDMPVTIPL